VLRATSARSASSLWFIFNWTLRWRICSPTCRQRSYSLAATPFTSLYYEYRLLPVHYRAIATTGHFIYRENTAVSAGIIIQDRIQWREKIILNRKKHFHILKYLLYYF